jgi:HEPN domain-containing protein
VIPGEIADAIRRLGRHYIPARYPDAHASGPPGSHYGAADAAEAVGDADAVMGFVDETWRELHG